MRGLYLALLIGLAPSVCMGIASFFLSHVTISGIVEACFQNLAAGLILAAVAAELFPLLQDDKIPPQDQMVGITIGFVVGLVILNGTEPAVEACIAALSRKPGRRATEGSEHNVVDPPANINTTVGQRKKSDIPFDDIEEQALSTELRSMRRTGPGDLSERDLLSEWAYDPVELSSVALAQQPNHRSHLEDHLVEIHGRVVDMEIKAARLVGEDSLSQKDSEQIAEEIDEAIHVLQYKLDHCRRYGCPPISSAIRTLSRVMCLWCGPHCSALLCSALLCSALLCSALRCAVYSTLRWAL